MQNKLSLVFVGCLTGFLVLSLSGCWSGCNCSCCSCKKSGQNLSGQEGSNKDNCDKCCHSSGGGCGCGCCSKNCQCCGHECKHEHNQVSGQKENKSINQTNVAGGNKMSDLNVRQKSNSGLEWEITKLGEGECPKKGQVVTVHYTGWLNEGGKPGRKFDSSVDRGNPFQFVIGVGQVIQGWDEGVINMKKGEKRIIYIPSHLGYGARGAGAVIPANANLIFEVELFDAR